MQAIRNALADRLAAAPGTNRKAAQAMHDHLLNNIADYRIPVPGGRAKRYVRRELDPLQNH